MEQFQNNEPVADKDPYEKAMEEMAKRRMAQSPGQDNLGKVEEVGEVEGGQM